MIDLKKAKLPQAVKVGGRFFAINTDFKYLLRFRELLSDKHTPLTAFDFMYTKDIPEGRLQGIAAIYEFMNPPRELPRSTTEDDGEIVIDYEIDAPYIYAAFLEQYGIDLVDTCLHWYKFLALLHGLHDTELNRIISARLWKPNGKTGEYEKYQQKQYEAWRLPQPEDNEPDEALYDFLSKLEG